MTISDASHPDDEPGVHLAVDYGDKRTGLAICDASGRLVVPHRLIESENRDEVVQAIKDACDAEQVTGLVMGLPLNMDGSESGRSTITRAFGKALEDAGCPSVQYFDERLTSWQVEKDLAVAGFGRKERKRMVDTGAACVILRGYLERHFGVRDSSGDAVEDAPFMKPGQARRQRRKR